MSGQLAEARCCYVIALAVEARPLLEADKWAAITTSPFKTYYASNQRCAMIISGIGRVNAAAATAYLGSCVPRHLVWINLGTAGHGISPIGEGFLIHKITDRQNNTNYYPLRLPYEQSAALVCYDRVQKPSALDGSLADMESAGFFPIARLFTFHELTHLYKIVADNQETTFKAEQIPKMIAKHLPKLSAIRDQLCSKAETHLAAGIAMEQQIALWLEQAAEQWHLSATQRNQLAQLLRQWFILCRRPGTSDSPFNRLDGKTVPQHLRTFMTALKENLAQSPRQ